MSAKRALIDARGWRYSVIGAVLFSILASVFPAGINKPLPTPVTTKEAAPPAPPPAKKAPEPPTAAKVAPAPKSLQPSLTLAGTETLKPGWKVSVYPMPVAANPEPATALVVPQDPIGAYRTSHASFALQTYRQATGINARAALMLEGYFKANEEGRYSYTASIDNGVGACGTRIWVEGEQIASNSAYLDIFQGQSLMAAGGANLVPGGYKIRTWVACTMGIMNQRDLDAVKFALKVKAPSDNGPRPIADGEIVSSP